MFQPFHYLAPHSLAEACTFLREHAGQAVPMAGGTDLLVRMHDRQLKPVYVVDIKKIPGLNGISPRDDSGLTIGACTPLNAIARHQLIREHYTLLAQAAHSVGSYQIRNRATIGGNLCNASPAADTAAPLLALNAIALIAGPDSRREVLLQDFFNGPGQPVLAPGELLTAVKLPPLPPGSASAYCKLMRTKAVDLSQVGVAVVFAGQGLRIALGAVAPTPIRATEAETLAAGRPLAEIDIQAVARAAANSASPIGDIRASREYRLEMIEVLTTRALTELFTQLSLNPAARREE
ncbi:MAG: FAD binding domain-containing protein [Bacillota bacterium]